MRSIVTKIMGTLLLAVLMTGPACGGGGSFDSGQPANEYISSTEPASGAADVDFFAPIKVTFSRDIDETTLTADTVQLTWAGGAQNVAGTMSYDAATRTLTFTPTFPLNAEALYTLNVANTVLTKAAGDGITPVTAFTTKVRPVLYVSNLNPADMTSIGPWNVWGMNADGTGKVVLTGHSAATDSPIGFFGNAWAPGYQHIAYRTFTYAKAIGDLWIMNADGSGELNITNGATDGARVEQVQWALDGTKVYYTWRTAAGEPHDLYAATTDGTITQLTGTTPAWSGYEVKEMMRISPDGTKMLIRKRSMTTDRNELYVVELNTTEYSTHLLTPFDDTKSVFQPEYSPDGTQVFFLVGTTATAANKDLYVGTLDAAGTEFMGELTNLTSVTTDESVGSFGISPTGAKLAFTLGTTSTATRALFIMNVDGSSKEQISSTDQQFSGYLLWSPDGTMLAFGIGTLAGGPFNLVITDPAGFTTQHIIATSSEYVNGMWSTDSKNFLFTEYDSVNALYRIFMAAADGSTVTNITQVGGLGGSFSLLDWWQPAFSDIR